MKQIRFAGTLCLVLFAVFAASTGFAQGAKPVVIKFIGGYNDYIRGSTEAAKEYMRLNPNVTIEVQDGGTNITQKFQVMIAANKLVDISHVPTDMVSGLVGNGQLYPITSSPVARKLLPYAKEPVTLNGELYTAPLGTGAYGLIYNPDLFARAGISKAPETLSELKSAVEKLKAAGITPFAPMIGEAWACGQYMDYVAAQVLAQNPGMAEAILKGTRQFTDPKLAETLNYLEVFKSGLPANFMDYKFADGATYFGEGKAAMVIHGDWVMPGALKVNPALKARITAIPWSEDKSKNKLILFGNFGFGILKSPETASDPSRLIEVRKFFDWFTSTAVQQKYLVPSHKGPVPLSDLDTSYLHPVYAEALKIAGSGGANSMSEIWKLPGARVAAMNKAVQGYFVGTSRTNQILQSIEDAIDLARK